MDYEGQICRPPMERGSFMLPVAVGCAYNRCRFCTLFKHLQYRELPLSEVEAEILRVKRMGANPAHVFLGDGNAFGLSTERLLTILTLIHTHFPNCTEVNMDATVTNISEKSDEELRILFEHGVRELYLGIETGDDQLLSVMKKDHSAEEADRQIQRMKAAGLVYNAHLMLGLAGAGKGRRNAELTAAFINRTVPHRIIDFTIFHHTSAPLYRDVENGTFVIASDLENLEEMRTLLSLITAEIGSFDGFNDQVELRVRGALPRDREKLLARLDAAIMKRQAKETVRDISGERRKMCAAI